MRMLTILFIVFLFGCTDELQRVNLDKEDTIKRIKSDTSRYYTALYQGDDAIFLSYVHPTYIKFLGGDKVMKSLLREGFEGLKKMGIKLKSISLPLEPIFIESNERFYVVITVELGLEKVHGKDVRYLIGEKIQEDKWLYVDIDVDSEAMRSKVVRHYFADFPQSFQFPLVPGTKKKVPNSPKTH